MMENSYKEESQKTIEMLLSDMPMPPEVKFIGDPLIMGTGQSITGKMILHSPYSPATNLDYYRKATQGSGWKLVSSTIAKDIDLAYRKGGKHLDVEMVREKDTLGVLFGGENNTVITVTVSFPDGIDETSSPSNSN